MTTIAQEAPVAPPAEPKTTPAPEPKEVPAPGKPAQPPPDDDTKVAPVDLTKEETAPETAEAATPEEDGEEEEISIEAVIDGEKRTLSGAEAVDYMNQTIEKAVNIFEATRKANLRRLENPLHAMIDELAAGKFKGNRQEAHAHLLQLMEKALLEHLEEQDKPEAERRARDLEAELAAARAELDRQKKEAEEEEWREQVADAGEKIAAEFHTAFKELELPDDDDLKGVIIERMLVQRRRGLSPTVRAVAEKVKNELYATAEKVGGRKPVNDKNANIEAVRKSREEEGAATSQKTPPKDGPAERKFLRSRDFLKD